MTPHEIGILLECYYCTKPGTNVMPNIWNSPMAHQTRRHFIDIGWIDPETFTATPKGNAVVERLCAFDPAANSSRSRQMPTNETPLERALAFIEWVTNDPLLNGDFEMEIDDVRKHAEIELASIRLDILAARKPIEFGAGKLVIDTGTYCEAPAVFVAPASMPGDVGTSAKREGHPTDKLIDGEIVMTFPTDAQAQIVADALVGAAGNTEPVAWQRRLRYSSVPGAIPQWEGCSSIEATDYFFRKAGYEYRPLYAHPPALEPVKGSPGEYESREAICTEAAMAQWERSLTRPDLSEKDRVRGAIEAYKRQAFAFHALPPTPEAPAHE